jgi:hypothetical protein
MKIKKDSSRKLMFSIGFRCLGSLKIKDVALLTKGKESQKP